MATELNALELELLKPALLLVQKLQDSEGREPTQEELKEHLHCASKSAKNIQHYLQRVDATKITKSLETAPERAEDRNTIKMVLGEQAQESAYGHLVRKNALLQAKVSRLQFKADADKLVREQLFREETEALKTLAKEELSRTPRPVKAAKDTDIMIEIAVPDLHVGKLAHSIETGGRPYDVKIAIATFERALEGLLSRTKQYEVEEFLLVVGNDLFNSDSPENTTTAGTAVSTDGRFHKTFHHVRTMMVQAIERLRHIAKVRVLIVPGNHDRQTAYHLGDSLECYFHSDPQVVVQNTPMTRKYVVWGKCLLGFCHGDEGSRTEYAQLMAVEKPEDWGATKFREVHTGHYHRQQLEEFHGVRVRILSALCPPDDWHSAQGYVGALRQAEAFVWSKSEGLLAQVYYNDDAQEPIITKREVVK